MKRLVIVRVLGFVSALVLLIAGSYSGSPAQADNGGNPGVSGNAAVCKVSSSLSLHIKLKTRALAYADNAAMGLPGLNPSSADPAFLNYEKVFLYFNQPPTSSQLADLNSEGVTAYPDSWIPPVGNHPTGFILADMPVDKLDALSSENYIVQIDTAEQEAQPQNDLARSAMGVDSVWSGGDTGVGVTVAVLDSGIDSSNPDFPALNASNSKDYSNYPNLDDSIINTVSGHGTHVTGSLLGRGVNSPTYQYKGVAPGAGLVFLKVGNDTTSAASSAALTYALKAAVDTYHVKIINLSYGEWSEYHDGSDTVSQAVDYATGQGASVFVAAGNDADKGWHYSGTAGANSLSGDIPLTIASGTNSLEMNMVWNDGLGIHNGVSLQYYDSNHNLLASTKSSQSESSKSGVESVLSLVNSAVPAGTYYIRVQNNSGSSQFFHLYYMGAYVGETSTFMFSSPDPNYTIEGPAEADTAIAVGAYVTRDNWTNYKGSPYSFNPSQTVGQIASYSSRGPRVDAGAPPKPDIVAPGTAIISVRDPLYALGNPQYDPAIIDNDGQNLNGSGPANYFIMAGTSMTAPMAAGVGALVLSKNPVFTPAQLKSALKTTATDKGTTGFDNIYGWGLVNAGAAVNYSENPAVITNAASSVSTTGATLNGNLISKGNASSVTVSFEYGLTTGYGIVVTGNPPTLNNPGTFSAVINGLTTGQTYHYRAKGDGGPGKVSSGEDVTFTASAALSIGRIAYTSSPQGNDDIFIMNADGSDPTQLTTNLYGDAGPSFSPDGAKIAYSGAVGPDHIDIFVMNIDGSSKTDLTNSYLNGNPSWSPDGNKIAFDSGRDGHQQIYVMNSDGSHVTRLTNDSAIDGSPAWSPDGQQIAFISNRDGINYGIYKMKADGTNLIHLTTNTTEGYMTPAWSPDGTKIVFTSWRNNQSDIYIMNSDGTNQIRLISGYYQAWSPDSSKIAFIAGNNIYIMNIDGSNPQKLTAISQNYHGLSWSIGRLPPTVITGPAAGIAFKSAILNGILTYKGSGNSVSVGFDWGTDTNYSGGNIVGVPASLSAPGLFTANLTSLTAGQTYHYRAKADSGTAGMAYGADMTFIAINPYSGGKIVFTSERDGNPEIYAMNADGSNPNRLTNNTSTDLFPAWSPDGTKIVFMSGPFGSYDIYVMHADGTGLTQLTNGLNSWNPSWSPDGSKIVFCSTVTSAGQIYVMNSNGSNKTQLTFSGVNVWPDWSADGKILFISNSAAQNVIYTMNADGSNQTQITSNGSQAFYPKWSPDGKEIVFSSNRDGHDEIFKIDSAGNSEIRLTNNSVSSVYPQWSPDGSRIVFSSARDGNFEIYTTNTDGTNVIRLTNQPGGDYHPDWTPGVFSQLVFAVSPGETKAGSIFTIQPVVQLQDALGNIVTNSNVPVSLTITSGTGKTGAVLSGTSTVNAVNGVATFSALNINLANPAGNQYTLTATSGALPAATSSPFCVDHPGDANGDGTITMGDVTKVEREILTLDPLTCGADPNNDGQVTMGDVTKIERIILSLDPTQG